MTVSIEIDNSSKSKTGLLAIVGWLSLIFTPVVLAVSMTLLKREQDSALNLAVLLTVLYFIFQVSLALALAWAEVRGKVNKLTVAACLWGIVLLSLPFSLAGGVLFIISAIAIGCAAFYTGTKDGRFRDLPSISAFTASWRQFRERRKTVEIKYTWHLARSQIPLFLVVLGCTAIGVGVNVLVGTSLALGHGGEAVMLGLAIGMFILASVLFLSAVMYYPYAQFLYGTVLQQFWSEDIISNSRKPIMSVLILVILDIMIVLLLAAPCVLFIWKLDQGGSDWWLLVLLGSWLLTLPAGALLRLHYRETMIILDTGPWKAFNNTLKLIVKDFWELVRGTVLQFLFYLVSILMATGVAPLALAVVAVPAALFGGLHALVWWVIGYQGVGHYWALIIELPVLLLPFLIMLGYMTSIVTLQQGMHRMAYVRKLLDRNGLIEEGMKK